MHVCFPWPDPTLITYTHTHNKHTHTHPHASFKLISSHPKEEEEAEAKGHCECIFYLLNCFTFMHYILASVRGEVARKEGWRREWTDWKTRLRKDTGTSRVNEGQRKRVKGQRTNGTPAKEKPPPHCDTVLVCACILSQRTCRYCIDLGCKG